MQAHWIASAIAVAAVIAAGALVLLARAPSDEPPLAAPSSEPLTIAISDTPTPRAGAPAPPNDEAAAKVRELEAMSETYRNTTFVIAIRDAGYTCNQLLRVYGIDDSGKWTVTCTELLGYTIGVTAGGALRVEPMMPYFDGLSPGVTIQNDNIVPAQPPPRLPPQTLPPQPR
jgi:hypothetical protein